MSFEIGVLFAIGALFFWGFGDFLIQKSTRAIGDWEALFCLSIFGTVILTPFAYNDLAFLARISDWTFFILIVLSITFFIMSLMDYEALKKGKLSIVEPIGALEIPITALLAFFIINESITIVNIILICALLVGLMLISLKSHHFSRKAWLERGVLLALASAFFMGLTNFLVGFASRITNPLLTVWFFNTFVALISVFYLLSNNRLGKFVHDFAKNKKVMISVGVLDNLAWVSFAFATGFIPIVIALALSESYIALAALLGIFLNRERLLRHQKIGLVISIAAAVILAISIR